MLSPTTPCTSRASAPSAALPLLVAATNRSRTASGSALKSISRALVISSPLSLTGYRLQCLEASGFEFLPALVRIGIVELDRLFIGLLPHRHLAVEREPVGIATVIHLLLDGL